MGRFGGRLPQLPPKIAAVLSHPSKPPVVDIPPGRAVPAIVTLEDWVLPQRGAQIAACLAHPPIPPVVNNPPFGRRPFIWGWGAPNVTNISTGGVVKDQKPPPVVNNPPFRHSPFDGNWTDWWVDQE